ncbi:tRNA (guanosine(46)-N7)-methyltransferase TrmB [Thorsellia anophelis]|uniref:tRNA (guanine-N(7)-)-methyltransferase n=1 Tax=Thorsellia anophelis DSM 18579 TaxID=1123402 RepID=A0A1H9Y2T6_9GAMM|nr:tRNA (guanosine(46)-N7)-methyltransferase TrmB [Thorsellia anophelis]SES63092.1 tRNA (guanine-N7-)-methyltransferase [Thorsellia anophelis DSM 18579]
MSSNHTPHPNLPPLVETKGAINAVSIENLSNSVISTETDSEGKVLRKVRSFVRRQGRLTNGQENALKQFWPVHGVEYQKEPLDLTRLFNNDANVTLEIGFGMGNSLVAMASENRDQNFLGIEVHLPGVGACLHLANETNLSNLKVMCHDAIEVLENMIPNHSLHMIQLFFPDPWHKARHHKRRIVQTEFLNLIHQKLLKNGVFHMATDWEPYAQWSLEFLTQHPQFTNLSTTQDYVPRPESRPVTKFEQRGTKLGHGVWDLMFKAI